jgi:predicted lipoprotein with Yx(FWY)xxD motif
MGRARAAAVAWRLVRGQSRGDTGGVAGHAHRADRQGQAGAGRGDLDAGGIKADPVYSYSKDSSSTSACTGSCAVAWPPVLTDGSAGVESPLSAGKVGTLRRSDGTQQVTYDGKPLYFYSRETPTKVVADDGLAFIAGNGSGIKAGGGTFELVTP